MFKTWTTVLFIWAFASNVYAESYLILFKHDGLPKVSKDAHKQAMVSLKESNELRINQLFTALGVNKASIPFTDLWLVEALEMQLKPEALPQVQQLPYVDRVILNKTRQYISPDLKFVATQDPSWGLKRLSLPEIRAEFPEANGSGVRVGIIDTGIQSRHPEFNAKNKVVFRDFTSRLKYPYDDNGHGTHVAGTIAGINTGIAPNVNIFSAKAFTATGSASDTMLLLAMQWLYDPDGNPETDDYPHVISNSWGLDLPFAINDASEFELIHRAIQAWVNSDIIPVFAAGNSGAAPNGMPGGFAESIAIAAIDIDSKIAEFSSRGPNYWKVGNQVLSVFKPDFAAPGVDIYSAWPGNGYAYLSGTSMATPHATGSIALILQQTGRISVSDLKTILLESMEPKFDFNFGSGIINPKAALEGLQSKKIGRSKVLQLNPVN
ncbi:MAG: S8 family serine peptidase [Proteobacteria bacterium]|nr:S8 family serine peptidase [Pseudomonadota bacterium]